MYFQRGLKRGGDLSNLDNGLRAVYFQRGLKPLFVSREAKDGLRAVYFQRGLKLCGTRKRATAV